VGAFWHAPHPGSTGVTKADPSSVEHGRDLDLAALGPDERDEPLTAVGRKTLLGVGLQGMAVAGAPRVEGTPALNHAEIAAAAD